MRQKKYIKLEMGQKPFVFLTLADGSRGVCKVRSSIRESHLITKGTLKKRKVRVIEPHIYLFTLHKGLLMALFDNYEMRKRLTVGDDLGKKVSSKKQMKELFVEGIQIGFDVYLSEIRDMDRIEPPRGEGKPVEWASFISFGFTQKEA